MKGITESQMLQKAATYCSAAERCISDVRKKIYAAGLSTEATERIIDRLVEEKFIDETRYAHFFVNDKFRFNKWGKTKINHELYRKEIPGSIREEALNTIETDVYQSTLQHLLFTKQKSTKGANDRIIFQKLLRYGISKGYESNLVIKCLRNFSKESVCEDLEDYAENIE